MLNIVLYQPEIPYNTGNIGRTSILTGARLHLIRPFPFHITDKNLKKAGMDYWKDVDLVIHDSYEDFLTYKGHAKLFFATTKASRSCYEVEYQDGSYIMFGPESRGIPEEILNTEVGTNIRIPMINTSTRSLNLSNSAAIIVYEALRQIGFHNMK